MIKITEKDKDHAIITIGWSCFIFVFLCFTLCSFTVLGVFALLAQRHV